MPTPPPQVIESTAEDNAWLETQIDEFNRAQISFTGKSEQFINYVIKENGEPIAGISSCFYFEEVLYINVLFVKEAYRHKNLGSLLLQKVENTAKQMGAKLAHLHTFDFQAKDFYLNHGYEIFGELENCPTGYKHYYLKKEF